MASDQRVRPDRRQDQPHSHLPRPSGGPQSRGPGGVAVRCRCPAWAEVAERRHECFVMDATVSVKAAETAELDDDQARRPWTARRLLTRRNAAVSSLTRMRAPGR